MNGITDFTLCEASNKLRDSLECGFVIESRLAGHDKSLVALPTVCGSCCVVRSVPGQPVLRGSSLAKLARVHLRGDLAFELKLGFPRVALVWGANPRFNRPSPS